MAWVTETTLPERKRLEDMGVGDVFSCYTGRGYTAYMRLEQDPEDPAMVKYSKLSEVDPRIPLPVWKQPGNLPYDCAYFVVTRVSWR